MKITLYFSAIQPVILSEAKSLSSNEVKESPAAAVLAATTVVAGDSGEILHFVQNDIVCWENVQTFSPRRHAGGPGTSTA